LIDTKGEKMFSQNEGKKIADYFNDMKRKPIKKINAEIDREDWEKIKSLAIHKKCPVSRIQEALVNFAMAHALDEYEVLKIENPIFRESQKKNLTNKTN
jgi:hypothetical protein